jgi:hypothetical protein
MKQIYSVVYRALFAPINKVPLGRWNQNNKKHVELNVMYSNEDHCGSCYGYIENINTNNKLDKESKIEEQNLNDEFICLLGTTADNKNKASFS